MSDKKRIIIFDMEPYKGNDYRVVCKFGFHSIINFSWWSHIEKKITVKKYWFFGPKIDKWVEVNRCWYSDEINSIDELKDVSIKFYEESIMYLDKVIEKAMSI